MQCPLCFYLDRRLGVSRPSGPPFTLNNAVDALLKKEFDLYRSQAMPHPLMAAFGVPAVPFTHPDLDTWRNNFKGVQYLHERTNLLVHGALDDLWVDPDETLHVVDYKATSTEKEITLDDEWKQGYKRQMEIYQWLLRRNRFTVSDTGYFLYVNADKGRATFDCRLSFAVQIMPYTGSDSWVENTLLEAHACLLSAVAPMPSPACLWCWYRSYRGETA
jgi:RecB family exonuclease